MVELADLSEEKFPPKFTIMSERMGELGFRAVYGIDFPYLKFRTSTGSDVEFIGKLMVHMGWRMEGLEHLTEAQRADLTEADMQAFCQALTEHEPTVFDASRRRAGEDWLAFVRRAGGEAVETRKGPFEKSAVLDMDEALSRNMSANSHMQSILGARPPRVDIPPPPRNPMMDMNSILERVEEDISHMARLSEASAALQSTLNDYAQSAIAEMKVGSERTEHHARRALWVGGAGVVTGALGILVAAGTWLWTADQQGKAEDNRKADAKAASVERQADREVMQQQLEAVRRTATLLEVRLPRPAAPVGGEEGSQQKRQARDNATGFTRRP